MKRMCGFSLCAVLAGTFGVFLLAEYASAYYHPSLGRWISRDPGTGGEAATRVGATGPAVGGGFLPRDQYTDGMNLYQYVASAPTRYGDPSGEQAQDLPVRLEVERLGGGGGSIEVFRAAGDKRMVGVVGEDSTLGNRLISSFNRFLESVDTEMEVSTWEGPTSFLAYLRVSVSASTPRRWQICPRYHWKLKVRNVCCISEQISVASRVVKGTYARAEAPVARIIKVPLKGEPVELEDMVLDVTVYKTFFLAKTFHSFAGAGVQVLCLPSH